MATIRISKICKSPQFVYAILAGFADIILISFFKIHIIKVLIIAILSLIFETVFNIYWKFIVGKRMFVYKYACLFSCNTSYLNIIFWFEGIFILAFISDIFNLKTVSHVFVLIMSMAFILVGLLKIVADAFGIKYILNYRLKIFYLLSFASLIITMFITKDIKNVIILVLLGLMAHVSELAMNLLVKLFSSDTYWDYIYKPYANRLSSIHNIIPFIYASALFISLLSVF